MILISQFTRQEKISTEFKLVTWCNTIVVKDLDTSNFSFPEILIDIVIENQTSKRLSYLKLAKSKDFKANENYLLVVLL